ncbi:hypothetical protein ACE1CI_00155, partial [Aerosakkonemataceae cyanobacterium BLCC-F50]
AGKMPAPQQRNNYFLYSCGVGILPAHFQRALLDFYSRQDACSTTKKQLFFVLLWGRHPACLFPKSTFRFL